MIKRMVIMLVLVGLVLGGIFGFQAFKGAMIKKYFATRTEPPQTVSTIKAKEEVWQPKIEAVGSLVAENGADLASEVSGLVARIHFKSGQEVKQGTLLVELDADVDRAQLLSLKAAQVLAQKNFERAQQLLKVNAASIADMDQASATLESTAAQVTAQTAVIEKKLIRAPFSGRLGIRAVDLGQYVNPGTKLVTLQQLDPIFVDFFVAQKSVNAVGIGQQIKIHSDSLPGLQFSGEVVAIDSVVDVSTRNVKVRAEVYNTSHQLLPGMFVTAEITTGKPEKFITLPQTSITFNPYGNVVFLVEQQPAQGDAPAKLTVKQKFVTTGETRGDQISVIDGVKEGEEIVTAGQLKLRNGSPVVVNNTIQPANSPAPTISTDR